MKIENTKTEETATATIVVAFEWRARQYRLVRGRGGSPMLEHVMGHDSMNVPRWHEATDIDGCMVSSIMMAAIDALGEPS